MQQFTVPQFLDVEEKIIGPITARQFVIMLGGFLVIGLCYKLFHFTPFVIIGLSIFGISGTFAFLKINGMPFHFFILNFTQTFSRAKLRVWNNEYHVSEKEYELEEKEPVKEKFIPKKPIAGSRLTELSLIVDTSGGFRGGNDVNAERFRNSLRSE